MIRRETKEQNVYKIMLLNWLTGLFVDRPLLEEKLLVIEKNSGKRDRKWQKTRNRERLSYIRAILGLEELKKNLYFKDYTQAGKQYLYLVIYALAELIISLSKDKHATVIIDALNKKQRNEVAIELRHFGIRTDKIKGKRDESSAMLRLADALAGFVRDGIEGHSDFQKIFKDALRIKTVREIGEEKTTSSAKRAGS